MQNKYLILLTQNSNGVILQEVFASNAKMYNYLYNKYSLDERIHALNYVVCSWYVSNQW